MTAYTSLICLLSMVAVIAATLLLYVLSREE